MFFIIRSWRLLNNSIGWNSYEMSPLILDTNILFLMNLINWYPRKINIVLINDLKIFFSSKNIIENTTGIIKALSLFRSPIENNIINS